MRKLLARLPTLRGRLLALVCFATLPSLLFLFWAARDERAAVLLRTEREALQLAQLASREHARQLEGARGFLLRFAARVADGSTPGLLEPPLLGALLAGHPQFANLGVAAPDGRVSASAEPVPAGASLHDNVAFARALGSRSVEIGEYAVGLVGRPVLHMAYAARDASGAVRAVSFVAVDLRWLAELSREADLPPNHSLIIADAQGRVLAESGTTAGAGSPQSAALIHALGQASLRRGGSVVDVDEGKSRLFVAAPMRAIPGVSVIAGVPYDSVYGAANAAFFRTAGWLALVALLAVAGTLFAAELSVLRVLRALSRAARAFGAGDLGARAAVPPHGGELTELTRSFNAMADALAARQREALETQAQLRALTHRLEAAREDEAGRIARELHDEVGQVLTSVKIDLSSLLRAYGSANAGLDRHVGELSERIDDAVGFVRRIASELRPAVLDRLGLVSALEWQAREFEARTGLPVVLEVNGVEEPIDERVSITVFRLIQEALTNVARHAEASHVTIDLRGAGGELALTVTDDGKGIDRAAAADPATLGILGMRERALLVGGTFTIGGGAHDGTMIQVRIPGLRAHEQGQERTEASDARAAG